MGYYIDPPDMSKEAWLAKHGLARTEAPSFDVVKQGALPVCLVDNGIFTAAGVAFSQRELEEFKRSDGRPRKWYVVSIQALKDVKALPANYTVPEFTEER